MRIKRRNALFIRSGFFPGRRVSRRRIFFKRVIDGKRNLSKESVFKFSDAEKSVRLLLELGFFQKKGKGAYTKTAASLTTGPQVRSVAVVNYHKAMMARASESMERFPADKRDITSLTLGVSEDAFSAIVAKIAEIRREFLEMSEADKTSPKVIQVNFQVFPVSQPIDTRGREQ